MAHCMNICKQSMDCTIYVRLNKLPSSCIYLYYVYFPPPPKKKNKIILTPISKSYFTGRESKVFQLCGALSPLLDWEVIVSQIN